MKKRVFHNFYQCFLNLLREWLNFVNEILIFVNFIENKKILLSFPLATVIILKFL